MKKSAPQDKNASGMPKHQKVLIGVAIAFLLYSVSGFLILPSVLKNSLEKKLAESLKREVSIEAIQINPYLLRATINNFAIKNRTEDSHFIAFDQLFVDLEVISVFRMALVVKTLTLTAPRVNVSRYKDLSYNFSDLADASGPKEETAPKPLLFSVNNIRIIDGSIVFADEPKETTHKIRDLNLGIPFLSSIEHHVEIDVKPSFSAIVNNTPIKLSGRTMPFHDTRKTVFDIRVMKLNIPEYLAYLPKLDSLTLQSGYLDIVASLGFAMQPGNKPAVTLNGTFSLKEINVVDGQGDSYASFPGVDLKLADSKPLELDFHVASVLLREPDVLLRRNSAGDILPIALVNISADDTPKPESQDNEITLKLVVDEITLNSGRVRFEDQGNAEQFQTILHPVEMKVTGLSTLEGEEASCDISMQTEAEESIVLNGTLSLSPLAVNLQADLQDLKLSRFSPYYSEIITPKIMEGELDLAAAMHYSRTDEIEIIKADDIAVFLDSLLINDEDDDKLLSLPSLSVTGSSLDMIARQAVVGNISNSNGELNLVRRKEGLVIVNELLRPREKQEETPDTVGPDTAPPWKVTLQKGTIEGFKIFLEDQTTVEPATIVIDNIGLSAANISTSENSSGDIELGLRIDKKGELTVKGPLVIEPLSAALDVKLAGLQVKTVQPYFADRLNLVINDGSVSLDGQLNITQNNIKKLSTVFRGKAAIAGFASFDPVAGEEFLKWQNLSLAGVEYDSAASSFRIEEITWKDFYNKIAVFDTGAINLKAVMKGSAEPQEEVQEKIEAPAAEKKEPLLVEIDSVKLENGKVDFLDRKITPNYASSFSELTGTITGLSSKADVMAEVNISGKLDQHAPLLITGKINPLRENLFADLVFDFRDIELSPTSPYTGKYIGYTVAKGKLSLDLKYRVEDRKIAGQNKAFLDQFTLGETVKSPDSLNLPINLAISLLRNRKGEITLNVPVKGDLDDPKFSIGSIIFKAIINLIAKAATSPFALLGALIPEGQDLQYIEFDAGSSLLTETAPAKLDTIAKVLFDRPGLKMDIKGNVQADQERPVLHEKRFQQLLKNEKFKKISKKKDETMSLDAIVIEPDEYEDYLKKAYKEATFEKPKNALGFTKRLEPEEIEKLLRDNIVITDDDLRLLAIERANSVKSYLVQAGPVEPERIFIIEPKKDAEDSGARRADMTIK